jgi:hypothetical protein
MPCTDIPWRLRNFGQTSTPFPTLTLLYIGRWCRLSDAREGFDWFSTVVAELTSVGYGVMAGTALHESFGCDWTWTDFGVRHILKHPGWNGFAALQALGTWMIGTD